MGFLGSVGSFLGTAAKAVATGGISLVAPKLIPKPINTILDTVTKAQFPTSLNQVLNTGLAVATRNPTLLGGGAQPMALNIGGILGQVGTIFGGNQNPVFNTIGNIANTASQFFPVGVPAGGSTNPTMLAAAPRISGAVATVGRSFFNRYPNLATAIQGYRNMGKKVTRAKLWSLVKRFGPEIVVSGGILTAAAVNELMIAGPGHRRMNPANVKALRKSLRRLESFHKLCARVDRLRGPRGRRQKGRVGSGSTFVRQG
jgi:hypothetical protein